MEGPIFPSPSPLNKEQMANLEKHCSGKPSNMSTVEKRNSVANEWCAGDLKLSSLASCFLSSCQKAGKRTSKARFHYSWELVARKWNVCNYFPSLPQSSANETLHTQQREEMGTAPLSNVCKDKQTNLYIVPISTCLLCTEIHFLAMHHIDIHPLCQVSSTSDVRPLMFLLWFF